MATDTQELRRLALETFPLKVAQLTRRQAALGVSYPAAITSSNKASTAA